MVYWQWVVREDSSCSNQYTHVMVSTGKDAFGESIHEERTTRVPVISYTSRQPAGYQVLPSSTKKNLYDEATAYLEDETSYTKTYENSDVSTGKYVYGEPESTVYVSLQ